MTHEEKVKYFKTALNIVNLAFNDQQTDLIVRLYDLIIEKKGDTTLRDITDVKIINQDTFKPQSTTDDKV